MINVQYGTQTIEFEVQRSAKAKNTYITVERDKGVLVKAPEGVSLDEIKGLVKKKAQWIVFKLEELGESIDYGATLTGSRLFYLGKSYYVELIKEDREDIEINFIHSKFKISTPVKVDQVELAQAVDHFYKEKAEEKITKLVKKWSNTMQLFPEYINFKKSKTNWGSCSPRNRITFNPEVMKLSSSLVEYVVIHELAHIAYKSHSKEFWNLIKKFLSDYSEKAEKIKIFERLI